MKLPLRILIHVIFWKVFFLFSLAFTSMSQNHGMWPTLDALNLSMLINTVWAVIIFYLFYFFLFKFFERGLYVKYLFISIGSAIVMTFMFMPFFKLIYPPFSIWDFRLFLPPMAGTFIIAQCGCLVRGFENWFETTKVKVELENRNLKNELELLKSQINPHFLFNSLNNIDMLIRKSPESASKSLITLSEMLRYMIYETGDDKVLLYKEIEYLKNFIELQKLRFKNEAYINYNFTNDCAATTVCPMLFVPFVENAFKHSVFTGTYPVIDIFLNCDEIYIHFHCENYFQLKTGKDGRPGGVGLENVKRRLALVYPGKHVLSIQKENDKFIVDLKIEK